MVSKYLGNDLKNKNEIILITKIWGDLIDTWKDRTDWGYIIADDNLLEGL